MKLIPISALRGDRDSLYENLKKRVFGMIDPGLKEKVVLVTGGNNPYAIGASIARTFASHGAYVFIHYFRQDIDLSDEKQVKAKTPR